MKYLPIFYAISERPCLVVGAGEIATRKIQQLRKFSAYITVVAPKICTALKKLAKNNDISYIKACFSEDMLNNKILVISATNDRSINQQISACCKARNIPVNIVDDPEICSFIMPTVVDRDPIQIAISTSGSSPTLARLLRAKLETIIPSSYGRLALLASKFRKQVKQNYPKMQERRRFWDHILQGPIAEMVHAGQDEIAMRNLEQTIQKKNVINKSGAVYLVGAGPGDPDLLTFRALRLMQQADVVLYDRLVAPAIVDLTRKDAERIYVGKKRDQHALPQTEINQLLIKLAKKGNRVLRLKGGDPFIFGRGGEEIELLAAANINFQIVPGITAASGCASYAGIPLTHRDYAHTCIFITGHSKDGSMDLNWESLVQPKQTIVVYMGIASLGMLSRELISHGIAAETPAALIQQGTTNKQKILIGIVENIADISKQHDIQAPAIIIIGSVVKLHKKLAWFSPSLEHI
ncbi:Siroheme synthase / Precorrin-2 oxidase / Sirohydrochlorin ferrochelatase / Uroporphyrinogen-III methyltransferase [uncultured Candidatus Thioglobus sp.]|nr:Siroheme synthase / Precorrin-2 oxidase / Sirohydrochlorin ferrochelatase / Uroporphyrinogen-III methyltransferase [uncultured Candidatus Thioglobus sp.]